MATDSIRDHGVGNWLDLLPLMIGPDLELNLNRSKDGWWFAGYADGESLEGPLNNGKTLADALAALLLMLRTELGML